MKILIVNDIGVLSGGAEQLSVVLRDGLRARGHDARLFTSSVSPVNAENPADYVCFGTESVLQRLTQIVNPHAMLSLRRALREFDPDVIHVRMFLGQLSPLILPLLRNRRCVLHIGSYQMICPLNTRMLPDGGDCTFAPGIVCHRSGCVGVAGLARTLAQSNAVNLWKAVFGTVVANSHGLAERLALGGLVADEVIWNGTPITPQRDELRDRPTAAYAGRLFRKKGILVLIRAMQLVVSKVPEALLIVAGDGPERSEAEALATETGIGGNIDFVGHLNSAQLRQSTNGAWVTVVPTIVHEGFSNTAIESMMRGTAVVATNAGGFPEMITDNETGLLVPRSDPTALAQALIQCLSSRALSETMGSAARRRALVDFTVDRMVARFVETYSGPEAPAAR